MTGLDRALAADWMPAAQADGWGHMTWDGGWWIVMGVGMILFWVLVALGIVWVVRELARRPGAGRARERPLEILDRSLAEGAISVEEYERRRRVLSGEGDEGKS